MRGYSSISDVERIYVGKVVDLFTVSPEKVRATYSECFPEKLEGKEFTRDLVIECGFLDSDGGFDDAACFMDLWHTSRQEMAAGVRA